MARRRVDPAAWTRDDYGSGSEQRSTSNEAVENGGSTSAEPKPESLAFSEVETHVSGRRAMAHIADGFLYTLIAIIPLGLAAVISNTAASIALIIFALPGPVAYYVLTQRKSGRSPGKSLMAIRVVDADGNVPTDGAIIRRTVPLLVEYFFLIAWAAMMSSPTRQRFGDRWAATYVIADEHGAIERRGEQPNLSCATCGEGFGTRADAEAHVGRFHPDELTTSGRGVIEGAPSAISTGR